MIHPLIGSDFTYAIRASNSSWFRSSVKLWIVPVKSPCIHGHSLDEAYLTTHYSGERKRVMRIFRPCQLARVAARRQKPKGLNPS